jgi:dihydroorotate dehydrogenase
MTKVERLSKLESKLRPFITGLSKSKSVSFYSNQKKKFLKRFAEDHFNFDPIKLNKDPIKLWDISFNFPLFNSAGMFKYAEGYYTVAKQGAGAWLSGTTTGKQRTGNFKNGVLHPFMPFPRSKSAINWMGLPNKGHLHNAKKIFELNKIENCPIGVSMSYDSGLETNEAMELMVEGLHAYQKAGVDFVEINESCPNVSEGHELSNNTLEDSLIERIEKLNQRFLKDRNSNLPVIIKLSNDTSLELIEPVIDLLLVNNFDGINLGNTSSEYSRRKKYFDQKESTQLDYFAGQFGGGVSGEPLKNDSFELTKIAQNYIDSKTLQKEFHVIRTGGIGNVFDINVSIKENVKLFQWYTGYFINFSKSGHNIYLELSKEMQNN